MATRNSTRAGKRGVSKKTKPSSERAPTPEEVRQAQEWLKKHGPPLRFPESVDDKITVAKSIVLAVEVAMGCGQLEDKNFDAHWPLSMAVELLEQASHQLDVAGMLTVGDES